VKVTLSATDPNNGSGVNKITYSASGGQNIAKTDASGSSVDVTLDQEGTTTLTYYATDNAGNVEDAKTLTVKIDKTAPTVTDVSPSDASTLVARSTNVTASFSEAIDPKTLVTTPTNSADPNVGTSTTFTLTKQGSTKPITATVSYDATNKKATLKPSVALTPSTTYTATVSGAKDMAGNTVAKKVWSFTTAKK
jgi:hypothetical protein